MANTINGGEKIHLMKYKGIEVLDGKVRLAAGINGKSHSSCGRRHHSQNATEFSEYRKQHPKWCCKACTVKFDALIAEGKKLKELAA